MEILCPLKTQYIVNTRQETLRRHRHWEKHKKLSDFIDFLALKPIILKLKVRKVAKSSYKVAIK